MPVRLTDDSREAWRLFARENGVTVTSLLETLGPRLNEAPRVPGLVHDAIEAARELDAERLRR